MAADSTGESPVKIPHLQEIPSQKHGVKYRYRRRVPPDMVAHVGRAEWATKPIIDPQEALAIVLRMTKIHDAAIARFRLGGAYEEADAVAAIEAKAEHLRSLRPDALEGELVAMGASALKHWIRLQAKAAFAALEAEHGGAIAVVDRSLPLPAGLNAMPVDVDDFMAIAGPIEPLPHDRAALSLADTGGRYRPSRLPLTRAYAEDKARATEPRDEKRIKLAVDSWIKACGDSDFMNLQRADVEKFVAWAKQQNWAAPTIKRRVVSVQGIHRRLVVHYGLPESSVWKLLKLKAATPDAKLPFNADHLAAIDKHLEKGKTSVRISAGLAFMRYCAMGPAEIIGLRRRDIQVDAKIPHVIVRANAERGLKTGEKRRRTIVLLGPALDAARAILKANDADYPFVSNQGGLDANSYSSALNAELREAGIPKAKRLTAYSFRHGIAEAMQQAGVPERMRRYIMGHAGHGVHDKYGAGDQLLSDIRAALKKAHARLGRVAESQYEEHELMPKDVGDAQVR